MESAIINSANWSTTETAYSDVTIFETDSAKLRVTDNDSFTLVAESSSCTINGDTTITYSNYLKASSNSNTYDLISYKSGYIYLFCTLNTGRSLDFCTLDKGQSKTLSYTLMNLSNTATNAVEVNINESEKYNSITIFTPKVSQFELHTDSTLYVLKLKVDKGFY